jgi:hypothetical protein
MRAEGISLAEVIRRQRNLMVGHTGGYQYYLSYRGSKALKDPRQSARNSVSPIGPHSFFIRDARKLLLVLTK